MTLAELKHEVESMIQQAKELRITPSKVDVRVAIGPESTRIHSIGKTTVMATGNGRAEVLMAERSNGEQRLTAPAERIWLREVLGWRG